MTGKDAHVVQLEVDDEAAFERTRSAALDMVMDRCPATGAPQID
ncbi:hypothetical protein [Streptomyces microflavus]